MSSKKLPPLSAIVAFDAVVRLGTFTRAASELHLTESAVSKQIKRLELSLGTPLFERKGNDVISHLQRRRALSGGDPESSVHQGSGAADR